MGTDTLGVILLAVAGFMFAVVRLAARRRPRGSDVSDVTELMVGFVYIGAGAMGVLGLVVIGVGFVNETFAANLAMLALFGVCAYLVVAAWFVHRR